MNESSKKPFSELLGELIELYRQLRKNEDKHNSEIEIDGDVDFLLNHYESIRNNLDEETFEDLGEPVRELLENLLSELRREMGKTAENAGEAEKAQEENQQRNEIAQIDRKLSHEDLTNEEINQLLDRRAGLQ